MTRMPFLYADGGRRASGRKGRAGDCVCRSIAIASGLDYSRVYEDLAEGNATQRKPKARSARNGVHTSRKWFRDYMRGLGFVWSPCMGIGTGCKVHLAQGELPMGRLVVSVSNHYVAVIDGVIHDTHDPQRDHGRCVYGYWRLPEAK